MAALGRRESCKLLGIGFARHAICPNGIARKTHPRPFGIRDALQDNVPAKEALAAHFKLN